MCSININKLHHIGVCVSNISKSLELYRDVLGFAAEDCIKSIGDKEDCQGQGLPSILDFEYKSCFLNMPSGEKIELVEYINPKAEEKDNKGLCGIGEFHIAFAVNDIDKWIARVEDAGYATIYKKLPYEGGSWVYFRDRDDVILEFIEEPGKRGNEDSIRFYHIGYTVTDINKGIEFYSKCLGLKLVQDPIVTADEQEAIGMGYPEYPDLACSTALLETQAGQTMELMLFEKPITIKSHAQTPVNTIGKCHAAFEIDDLPGAAAEIGQQREIEAIYRPLNDGTAWWAYYKDFDDTIFELYSCGR